MDNDVKAAFFDTSIRRLQYSENYLADQADPIHSAEAGRAWAVIKLAFDLFDISFTLNRFLDRRYPAMREAALPDGENIVHPHLRAAWAQHRSWTRILHYRSLFVGKAWTGLDHLCATLWLAYAFLRLEMVKVPFRPWWVHQTDRHPELGFMDDMMDELLGAMRAMGDVLAVETRPETADGPYTEEETLLFNSKDDQIVASFQNV